MSVFNYIGSQVEFMRKVATSRYSGKKVSIIGDSISAYNGTMPAGYPSGYPNPTRGVTELEQMWWMKVIGCSGGQLEVNAGYNGSCASSARSSLERPDFYDRVSVIGNPDTILVELGTNDSDDNVALGEYDYTTTYTSLDESKFRPAYIKGVKGLQANYPDAEIVLVITNMADAYALSIINIGGELGCDVYDVRGYDTPDGDNYHPTGDGMRQIATALLAGEPVGATALTTMFSHNSGDAQNAVYLEEADASGGSLYFKCARVNMFFNGGNVNEYFAQIVSDVGGSTTTSAKGVAGCLEIPNNTALVFNTRMRRFRYLLRTDVTKYDVVLFLNAYGRADNLHPSLMNLKVLKLQNGMPCVNVKSFGAKGDGATDDTAAIQAALDSLQATGGTVFVPAGTYLLGSMPWDSGDSHVSACLHIYSNQTLEMDSGAVLKRGSGVNHMIFTHNADSATGYTGAENITIRGGTIDENSALNTNDTAVNITHAFNVLIENVTFKNASGTWHYIEVNSAQRVRIIGCNFLTGDNSEDIQIDAAVGGGNLGQDDGTVCRDIEIADCYFDSGAHPGIGNHNNYAHSDIRIHGCVFHNDNQRGAIDWVALTCNVDAYCNTFYENDVGMGFAASQSGSTFHDNRLYSVTTPAVNCTAYNNVVDGSFTPGVS